MPPNRPTPQLRASDADRDRAALRLREAAAEGRLDTDELEERVGAVYGAKWMADLDRLTSDVTPLPPPTPVPPPVPVPPHCYSPYPPVQQTNGLAVASLVAGLVWMWWLGSVCAVIFGHISLKQINESGGRQSGRGMAIAGLVLGYLGVATLVIVGLVALGA
jgi:hypothetical protein